MAEWIPVSERLPDDETSVITCDARGYIAVSTFYASDRPNASTGSFYALDEYLVYPVAWMPLPDPYKKNKNNIVDVVRCKDCKHYYKDDGNVVVYRCELCHEDMRDDFYCADGESR